jgi:hypothetical protein
VFSSLIKIWYEQFLGDIGLTQTFKEQWKQRLWEFERTSMLSLGDIPESLNEETVVSYIKKHKYRQKIGSSLILWMSTIWFPLGALTGFLIYLVGRLLGLVLVMFSSHVLLFVLLFTISTFAIAYVLDERAIAVAKQEIFLLGWTIGLILHIPFFPLIHIRNLQVQYAQRYWKTFFCIFWRPIPATFRTEKATIYIDQKILEFHKQYIASDDLVFKRSQLFRFPVGISNNSKAVMDNVAPRCDLIGFGLYKTMAIVIPVWAMASLITWLFFNHS